LPKVFSLISMKLVEKIKQKFRAIALKGGNVYCNLCNQYFLTFLPAGDDLKAHTRCPNCLSIDRQRQIYTILKPLLEKKLSILHIAPEKGLSKKIMSFKQIDYHAIDLFTSGYSYPKYVKNMNLLDLEYKSDFFDIIVCSHVLEHIQEDSIALSEMYRVLKKGGKSLIVVPYFPELTQTYENKDITLPEDRKVHFGQYDHVRKYGKDIKERIENSRFKVSCKTGVEELSQSEKVKFGFINAEPIFIAEK